MIVMIDALYLYFFVAHKQHTRALRVIARQNFVFKYICTASVEKRLTKFVDNETYITASVLDASFKVRYARSTQHAAITDSLSQKVKIVCLNRDTPT